LAGVAAFGAGSAPPPRRLVLVSATPWTLGGPFRLTVAGLLDALARPLGYLPVRALRLGNNDEPASYFADLAGWARSGRWGDWLQGAAKIVCPARVIFGDRDLYCSRADARTIADRLGGPVSWRR